MRWAELLGTLSQHIPRHHALHVVDAGAAATSRGRPPAAARRTAPQENMLASSGHAGSRRAAQPLLEVAQFMAGLMRDPAVNKRFQLKSWDIKPGPPPGRR